MATILVVDDEPATRRFLARTLLSAGHEVREAADGTEGLRLAAAERFDLVISDIVMPTMDGFEFVRRLRTLPLCPPVIVCTAGHLRRQAAEFAQSGGVASILHRPAPPAEVLRTVDRVLDRERLAGVLAALAGRTDEDRELYAEVRRYITALEREVLEREQAEREAREAHAANERLLLSISSVLIGLDGQMRIQKWNAVAETVLGIPASQVLGRPFGEAGLAWVDERVLEGLRACHQRQQKTFLEDIAFTRADGNRGYLGLSATPVPFADGGAPGTLLLGADLTERRLLGAQLAQAQRLESIGQLAAGIAHEINTPIQYIGDNTRFLADSFEGLRQAVAAYAEYVDASRHGADAAARVAALEERLAELDLSYLCAEIPPAIEQTLQGVESVAKIVRAMKEFSHPGGEAKTAVNLNRAIENTVLVSRNEWKYVADVVTDFDTALPPVCCYPGEFNQVVLNLIINAAHAIEERRQGDAAPKGTITISTRRLDECVQVQVRDTGCGIPEAVRARVFDPFFTTKPVGKGTGQGLALAHAIMVRRHGGTIGFDSQVGEGTTFTLTLPLAAEGVLPVSRGPTWAALPAPVTQGLS